MLETIRKRLHHSKYVFTIHLHHITPWFIDDKTTIITWKRGNKKNRRGQIKSPTKQLGNDKTAILNIDESFDLDVTLYSESGSTRKTGPYYSKELELEVKELRNDKSVRRTLGVVNIKLNEFADLLEHSLKLPLKCEKSVTTKIGSPVLHLRLRSWLKKSTGDPSTISGLTSIGMSPPVDQSEDSKNSKCENCDFEDPVKIMDDVKNSTSVVDQSMELIIENAVLQEDVKSDQRLGSGDQEVPVILTQNEDNTIILLTDSDKDRTSKIDQKSTEKIEEMDAVIEVSSSKKEAELKVQDQDLVLDNNEDSIKPSDSINSIQEQHSTEVIENLNKTQTPQNLPSTKPGPPRWFNWISWIPGSRLMCCQPVIPKEP